MPDTPEPTPTPDFDPEAILAAAVRDDGLDHEPVTDDV